MSIEEKRKRLRETIERIGPVECLRRLELALDDDILSREAYSDEEVDEILREGGLDPDEVARQGKELIEGLLKEREEKMKIKTTIRDSIKKVDEFMACLICEKEVIGIYEIECPEKNIRENVIRLLVHRIDEDEEEILITGCFVFAERKVC